MPKFDVTDEAIISAPPTVFYRALLDEYAGVTHWWMPYFEFKPRGDKPMDQEGAIFDIIIHDKMTLKFSAKITKIVEAESIEEEYAGEFVGTGKWTLEPTSDGKTKVQFRVNGETKRLSFVFLSPFVDIGKKHSIVIQKGFKACNSYLCKK
ncbi:MAG: SRPBCC family protein [Candidatus Bathyarchaeia archaeon]|jgi:uncharacterized protein YndB with AHSA1/START domain